MVRDHLIDKIQIVIIGNIHAAVPQLGEQKVCNILKFLLIEKQGLGVADFTFWLYGKQGLYAFILLMQGVQCYVLQWDIDGILQDVLAHLNGTALQRNHLRDEVMRDTVCKRCFCYGAHHLLQGFAICFEVVFYCNAIWLVLHHKKALLPTNI